MIQYLICRVPFPAHSAFPIPQRAQPTCIHCARYLLLSILANIHHTYLDPARTPTSSKFFKSSKVVKGTWNDLGRISRGRSYSDNQRTIRPSSPSSSYSSPPQPLAPSGPYISKHSKQRKSVPLILHLVPGVVHNWLHGFYSSM